MDKISRNLRKYLALTIACCLFVTVIGPINALAEDISKHWAAESINLLVSKNIVRGDNNGNINPDNNITRAEFVAIINRTFEFIAKDTSSYPDVGSGKWYYNDFLIAKKAGYILGDNNGNANPDKAITRAEVVVILDRILNLSKTSAESSFADKDSFPAWSVDSIIALTDSKLVNGYPDNTFRASNSITRAEAFTILARIIEQGLLDKIDIGEGETPLDPGGDTGGGGSGGSGGGSGTNHLVQVGQNIVVTVTANSVQDMYSYQCQMNYNKDELEFTGTITSKISAIQTIFSKPMEGYELIGATMVGEKAGVSGNNITVCEMVFKAKKSGVLSDFSPSISNVDVVNSELNKSQNIAGWSIKTAVGT